MFVHDRNIRGSSLKELHSLYSLVRYHVQHSKINSLSTRTHVMYYLLRQSWRKQSLVIIVLSRVHYPACLEILKRFPLSFKVNYYTSDSLWKIWLVQSIRSIHNSLWTWHDKCNICCRYCIYHVKFNICLVTKPLGVFSETKWLNASLLFLRMNYVKNV